MQLGTNWALELNAVELIYPSQSWQFNLKVPPCSINVLAGSSGCGKTTLLNLIAGFICAQRGEIFIHQQNHTRTPVAQRPVSMIFQQHNLFAHLDVFTNIALGVSPYLKLNALQKEKISATLAQVNLRGYEHYPAAQLSGGEQQRVALARVLLRNRPILLLDEALVALDQKNRIQMLDLLSELYQKQGLTILMVTHQLSDATYLNAQTFFLEKGKIILG